VITTFRKRTSDLFRGPRTYPTALGTHSPHPPPPMTFLEPEKITKLKKLCCEIEKQIILNYKIKTILYYVQRRFEGKQLHSLHFSILMNNTYDCTATQIDGNNGPNYEQT
jgi:hypothetical protein